MSAAPPPARTVTVEVEMDVLMAARLDRFRRLHAEARGLDAPLPRGRMLAALARRELYRSLAAIQRENALHDGIHGTGGAEARRIGRATPAEARAERDAAAQVGEQASILEAPEL